MSEPVATMIGIAGLVTFIGLVLVASSIQELAVAIRKRQP